MSAIGSILPELARLFALIGIALLPFVIVSLLLESSSNKRAVDVCRHIDLESEDGPSERSRALIRLVESKSVLTDRAGLLACSDGRGAATLKY